jgi:hypothetical protein
MTDGDQDDSTFGLDKVLLALWRDIKKTQAETRDDPLGLKVQRAGVELAFTVESSKKGGLGVNLRVLGVGADAGGERGSSSETVHRIHLLLAPTEEVSFVVPPQ